MAAGGTSRADRLAGWRKTAPRRGRPERLRRVDSRATLRPTDSWSSCLPRPARRLGTGRAFRVPARGPAVVPVATMSTFDLDTDAAAIAGRLRDADTLLVACLCAEWCGTCREYRTMFDLLAVTHPRACFVWIDVETHAELVDEFDVENFPTILIEDGLNTRFFRHCITAAPYRRTDDRGVRYACRRSRRIEIPDGACQVPDLTRC